MRTAWFAAILIFPATVAISAPRPEGGFHSGNSLSTAVNSGSESGSDGGRADGGSSGGGSSGGSNSGSSGAHSGGAPRAPTTSAAAPRTTFRPSPPSGATSRQPPTTIPRGPLRFRSGEPNLAIGPRLNQPGRGTRENQPRVSRPTSLLHQRGATNGNTVATRDGRPHEGNWSRNDPANRGRFDRRTQDRLRNWQGKRSDFAEACQRHNDHHRHHHNRDWWLLHCPAIVLVDLGFWGWWEGWWYPAWGYDANYSYYEYDGPIYGGEGLLPDEIIANVQAELQKLGYYPYEVDGIFGPLTQEALARFQSDHGIPVSGAIDPQTLVALGLL